MLPFSKYLKKLGLVTGPRKKHTSYSGLEALRKILVGDPPFVGGEEFFQFGSALHEVYLENDKRTYKLLPEYKQELVNNMVARLRAHPVVCKLVDGAVKEKRKTGYINGVKLVYILDIDKKVLDAASDLKSTACTNQTDCLKKAILYGYVKQRGIYKAISKRKEFYLIFVSKKAPHDIFILGDKDFEPYEKYAWQEIEWLLYVYKHYGKFLTIEEQTQLENDRQNKKAARPNKQRDKKIQGKKKGATKIKTKNLKAH